MKREKEGHEKAMNANAKELIITMIVLVALVSSARLALAAELTVTPNDITPGEIVTITGTGFKPNGTITVSTTVTCWKPVSDGFCECSMINFDIPANTRFELSVRKVTDNVSLYIKKGIWLEINPGLTSFFTFQYTGEPDFISNVSSKKIPPSFADAYSIDVIGDAVPGEENCTMTTSAFLDVNADADGDFTLDFHTHGIPICNFTITATDGTNSSSEFLNLFLPGDASKDGRLSAYDCVCIARYCAEIAGYDNCTVCCSAAACITTPCDVVDVNDARYLARYLIGKETSMPGCS